MELTKEVVSVSDMARMLGLSRARFYQLMGEGVFPEPVRGQDGARPYFDRQQQQMCLEVRRTNRGVNGRSILFYAVRLREPAPTAPTAVGRRRSATRPAPKRSIDDVTIHGIRHGLCQLGLNETTEQSIRAALADAYPDGFVDVDAAELLRAVFERLNRQNSNDNVAG